MALTRQNKILIALIFWVIIYSHFLRTYYSNSFEQRRIELEGQIEFLQSQLSMSNEAVEQSNRILRNCDKKSPAIQNTGEPKQPGEIPEPISVDIKTSTAKDYIEKSKNEKLYDHFFNLMTQSSLALSSEERARAGLEPSPSKVQPWFFTQRDRFHSTPYQVTIPEDEPPPPTPISVTLPPQSVKDEVISRYEPRLTASQIERVCSILDSKGHSKLSSLFRKCFPNTLETTTQVLTDNTTYVITGDIDLMWLRDSSAQVHQYLRSEKLVKDPEMQRIIEGLIRRQLVFIQRDPYGSSFRLKLRGEDDLGDFHVGKARNLYVAMHNYELDSICYPIALAYQYWKASGQTTIFTAEWKRVAELIMVLWTVEQYHDTISPYTYLELHRDSGKWSSPVKYTGMTWCSFRPSDDQTQYGYLIPSNMFAVKALDYLQEIFSTIYKDSYLVNLAKILRREIDDGIHKHGVITDSEFGKVYAYEVDGNGGKNMMDDANVPSLLSIPYLGYTSAHDPNNEIAQNTRKFVLSKKNHYYYEGTYAKGIGSPHTPPGNVWPMAIIMQGLTTTNEEEIKQVFKMLEATDAGTDFMHESFNPSNPSSYSRYWFAWANSLFSELVLEHLNVL